MKHHRLDDLLEYALTRRGRENITLAVLAGVCIGGIVLIAWL